MTCSAQDLLAERRANVLEQARESDPIARAMLQAHIDELDREIKQVTDGAARRYDVRDEMRVERAAAQPRSRRVLVAGRNQRAHSSIEATVLESAADERSSATSSGQAARTSTSSNRALQQGQDLPPSTSSRKETA